MFPRGARPNRVAPTLDEGEEEQDDWVSAEAPPTFGSPVTPDLQQQKRPKLRPENGVDTPPPSPPSPSFAPMGRPLVRKPSGDEKEADQFQRAVVSTISGADNTQFLEQFRYTVITSHLLGPSAVGQRHMPQPGNGSPQNINADAELPSVPGVVVAVASAFVVAWTVQWVCSGGFVHLSKRRVAVGLVLLTVTAVFGHAFFRQQWLRHVRQSALTEARTFVTRSHDFDSAASAAISFIKEVELVSRGYRLSAPLPPISRMDDRSQTRRCMRLRKAVRGCFSDALPAYKQATTVVQCLSEQVDLEMYYHVYDITDFDVSDAMQGLESEFADADSLRTLTVVAARFHTVRRMFLCALLALEANDDESDFLRWSTAAEGLRTLNESTNTCYGRLQTILGEVEMFSQDAPLKAPLSPGRERWRSQLGKLNSLSTGIRGLQAKLALLREESDRTLNEAKDISHLGPNLMAQYDSIGQDLKLLIQAWEEGKSALASGINRNEKRLSSIGMLMSPTFSLSGLTAVGDSSPSRGGTAEDALHALNGGSPLGGSTVGDPEEEVVFEAVSLPPMRSRSLLSRGERLSRMKEDRERRAEAREQADASRGMLRELEMVINLRPKLGRVDAPAIDEPAADELAGEPSRLSINVPINIIAHEPVVELFDDRSASA
ncbi:proliferating cell nuclear antigen [Grosmannia clavigera kw1407]|uniref:Vezatin n=1 Tax=Grosmannia clavigera (strain kw1407 / UAMH 11150) TaxID=655863 RepID=F0XIM0_GROCL|nr:proliferating cell nuclear antigen [Grosmannia clavigera kw1407]EFX02464.1 proliferating cell nuclear antigen [Grosmannia clavigera kw1407]